jgi:hypothetical protein
LDSRHQQAVARTLEWAADAARRNDLRDALAWLETIEAVDERLPEGWEEQRKEWEADLALSEKTRF